MSVETVSIAIDVEEIIRGYQEELPGVSLDTWESRMLAITEGVIDYDDVEWIALACAAVADRVPGTSWADKIEPLVERFVEIHTFGLDAEFESLRQTFIECGRAADQASKIG